MSRIRSIHPGLWTDERFVSVQPVARLLFMGIWNECDDQGIFEWSPLKLKMRLLPADNADAAALLDELEGVGSILRFTVAGKIFGAVRNFTKYQRPKKPNSVHPTTPQAVAFAAGSSEPVTNQLPTEEEIPPQREEEGGRRETPSDKPEGVRAAKRGTRLPTDFVMPEEWKEYARSQRRWSASEIDAEATVFANHWQTKPGKDGLKLDWQKTWQNWVLNSRRANGTSAPPVQQRPMTLAQLENAARFREEQGDLEKAAEYRSQAARMRGPPSAAQNVITRTASALRA